MKLLLQYLWIERYGCIEKQGYNFSSRVNIKFDYEKNKLSIDNNSKNYCENFFGENIDVSCIVGKNGTVKCYTERAVDKHPKIW